MNSIKSTNMNIIYVLIYLFVISDAKSTVKVSDSKNTVNKRQADFYPDWVPFKNKHGEELGEFVQVEPKAKPKKRLAPPMNFILRAVEEPQGDDYYEKGQGESEGVDYYERKEWSDVNRPADLVKTDTLNHTQLSDIDGVVDIIIKPTPSPLVKYTKHKPKTKPKTKNISEKNNPEKYKDMGDDKNMITDKKTANGESTFKEFEAAIENSNSKEENASEERKSKNKPNDSGDVEYEEETAETTTTPASTTTTTTTEKTEEQKANEAKKAKILNEVDELKERHAEEQRLISEKVKEEEDFERNKFESKPRNEKYEDHPDKPKLLAQDYDDYIDKEQPLIEKYKPHRKLTTTSPSTTKSKMQLENVKTGKVSVFKNPALFITYDELESDETTTTTTKKPIKSKRPRLKTSTTAVPSTKRWTKVLAEVSTEGSSESEQIFLEPKEVKHIEPTLFFPKKKKNKSRRKFQKTTQDSIVDESKQEKTAKNINVTTDKAENTTVSTKSTPLDTTAQDSAPPSVSGPSVTGSDTTLSAETTASDKFPNKDAVAASSDHKEKEKKHENFEHEKGGGRDYRSQHHEEHGEHGKKAYEGHHEDTKTAKGHHDEEDHTGKYDDNGGHHKEHHDEKNYFGGHSHEEHGKKHAKYEESGKHSKGHNTKGSHDIHKKEEYEKKVEFFEEDGDSAEEEKFGGHNSEHEYAKGGHFKKGGLDAGHHHQQKGDSGHFGKGGHVLVHKGHRGSGGHDSHGHKGHDAFHKEGHQAGKKWVYHHGYPAKNANLVVIDRRADKLAHGPQYFG